MTTRGLSPARRGLVGLAPGGVVVVRRRLDLAGAGVDAAVRGPHAATRAAWRARCRGAAISASESPSRLSRKPVVGDEVVDGDGAAQLEAGDLLLEPRVHALGHVRERRPGRAHAASSSRERIAFRNASLNVRPIPIASPTDFICVPSVVSAPGNFSKAKRGNLTTT